MDTPRKTRLYNEIAKDFAPKQAAMMICRCIEGLERRVEVLENGVPSSEPPKDDKPPRNKKKDNADDKVSVAD